MRRPLDLDRLDWLANRARKETRRRRRKELSAKRRRESLAAERQRYGSKSKILALLSDKTPPQKNKIVRVQTPKRFSIIDNPRESLLTIRRFATEVVSATRLRRIEIDHRRLENTDLGANAVLDLIASEIEEGRRIKGRKRLKAGGFYPKNEKLVRFIKGIGIIRHMKVEHEAPTADESEKLQIFDRRNKHYDAPSSAGAASTRDHATVGFVEHIDDCLKANGGRGLTKAHKRNLSNYVTEILSNAEEHAGFVDWSMLGYLDNSEAEPTCEIALFNFGRSIAESFQALDRTSYPWLQIQPYIDTHLGKSWFNKDWQEEDLLTVVALQPHVSRANTSEDDTRGQGTVDLINFFQQVRDEYSTGDHPAEMVIISGRTYIKFDGKYRMASNVPDGSKVIAFNATNQLTDRPDSQYVRNLKDCSFPGTIICIKFPLGEPAV